MTSRSGVPSRRLFDRQRPPATDAIRKGAISRRGWADHTAAAGRLAPIVGLVPRARGGIMSELLLDRAGRRRSPATMPGFHAGHAPGNKDSNPRHHVRLPPGHRQRRDHRDRPRPTCSGDPRQRLAAALIECSAGSAHRATQDQHGRSRGNVSASPLAWSDGLREGGVSGRPYPVEERGQCPVRGSPSALRLLMTYLLGASEWQPQATIVGMLVVQRSSHSGACASDCGASALRHRPC